jgi:hypothetical protein
MRHDAGELFPPFKQIKQICRDSFPGAILHEHHGHKQYLLVWQKP